MRRHLGKSRPVLRIGAFAEVSFLIRPRVHEDNINNNDIRRTKEESEQADIVIIVPLPAAALGGGTPPTQTWPSCRRVRERAALSHTGGCAEAAEAAKAEGTGWLLQLPSPMSMSRTNLLGCRFQVF